MKQLLARYLELFPTENGRLRQLQEFLCATSDTKQLFHRMNFSGHITASGFVLSPDGKKLALVKHKYLGRHLQPGGHVEDFDADTLAAAVREVHEETGIQSAHYLTIDSDPLVPFDIDTHAIPANPKKDEAGHWHHDFRYLFRAKTEIDPAKSGGEAEWRWHPVEDAIKEETFALVISKLRGMSDRDSIV